MTKVLREQLVDTKKLTDLMITLFIIVGAFVVPTFLAKVIPMGKYQQIIVGTIVNTSLICTALYTKGSIKTIAIATLPSMSNILGGFLFTPMTLYAQIMIPAIILGNFVFMLIYKALYVRKKTNYLMSGILAVAIKVGIIYTGFCIMNAMMNLPTMVQTTLNTSMGITQCITATCGSLFAFLIVGTTKMLSKNSR